MTTASKTFSWGDGQSWLPEIEQIASSVLSPQLRDRLKRKRAKCWSDNMSWLGPEETFEAFQALFLDAYDNVTGFHGCRPTSVTSYMERGLLGQAQETIVDTFRRLYSDVTVAHQDDAIKSLSVRGSNERGKIFFCATAEQLIDGSGHYLIQGSEYLMSLAAALCSRHGIGEDYPMRLRNIGIPTIFEVDIPVEYLPEPQLESLCRTILSAWGQQVTNIDVGIYPPCYIIHCDVEPVYIRRHHHPAAIRDPHRGNTTYRFKDAVCDACPSAQ